MCLITWSDGVMVISHTGDTARIPNPNPPEEEDLRNTNKDKRFRGRLNNDYKNNIKQPQKNTTLFQIVHQIYQLSLTL